MWVQLIQPTFENGQEGISGYYQLDDVSNLNVSGADTDGNHYVQVGNAISGPFLSPAYPTEAEAQSALESLLALLGLVTLPAAS